MNKKIIAISVHVLFIGILMLVPLYIMSRNSEGDMNPYFMYLISVGTLAILFYINYLWLIDKLLFGKRVVLFTAANVFFTLILVWIQQEATSLLIHPPADMSLMPAEGCRPPGPPPGIRRFMDTILCLFCVGMSVAMKVTARWYRDSIRYEKGKTAQLEADLRALRSQLNPHFLFNTLNNIYSLISSDQSRAQTAVHRLSHLLRFVLYENGAEMVPLERELEFTGNYIDLMKLRLGSEISLSVKISDSSGGMQVVSLLFMTLIENAFKHGPGNAPGSFISIDISAGQDHSIICRVENSLAESAGSDESGIGLSNLRRRLELLYPGRYTLALDERNGTYCATLKLWE